MYNIISHPYNDINLNDLILNNPYTSDGTIVCDITLGNNNKLMIQTPNCLTKKGIIDSSNNLKRKIYCDLEFDKNNTEFINFIQDIESNIIKILKNKKDVWFANEMNDEDIEHSFNTSFKYSKKKYFLRAINSYKKYDIIGKSVEDLIRIFDENQIKKNVNDIDINEIITILQLTRVKCSSISFNLEFNLKQIVILDNDDKFDECLVVLNKKNTLEKDKSVKVIDEQENDLENVEEKVETEIEKENIVENVEEGISEETEKEFINEENEQEEKKNNEELENINLESENVEVINEEELEEELKEKLEEKVETEIEKEFVNEQNVNHLGNLIEIKEIEINNENNENSISLKNPNDVMIDIYKESRRKAKIAKQKALNSYLELNKIRNSFMLDGIMEFSDEEEELNEIKTYDV
mgnify:CR=1 FL=1